MGELKPKLGNHFTVRKRAGEAGLPTLSVTMRNGLVRRDSLDRKMDSKLAPEQHLRAEPGDLAYNMMRMWQGALGIAEERANVSPAYVVMEPNETMDSRFAFHWLKSDRMLHYLWAYSHGLTNDRLRLYPDDFSTIPVGAPSLSEQLQIAAVLDTWDAAIATAESIIAVRGEYQLKVIRKLSTQWSRRSLDGFGEFVGGGTPSKANPSFWTNGTVSWVSSKDMGNWQIFDTENSITEEAVRSSSTRIVPQGSVLFVTRSGILRHTVPIGVAMTALAINQDIKAIEQNGTFDGQLLTCILRVEGERLRRESVKTGTTVESIDLDTLKQFQVPYPASSQEHVVTALLGTLAEEIDRLTAYATLLRRQKRGLMQKLLTGEVRVPESIERLTPAAATEDA